VRSQTTAFSILGTLQSATIAPSSCIRTAGRRQMESD